MSEWGNPPEVNAQVPVHEFIVCRRETWGTETSKYPQEEKAKATSPVAASEKETAQTVGLSGGVVGLTYGVTNPTARGICWNAEPQRVIVP